MKKILIIFVIFILISPAVISDVIPTPYFATFYGQIYIGTINAEVGTVVDAYDPDGVHCGSFTVETVGQFGMMAVYGDDLYSTVFIDEGAIDGDVITFFINGREASLLSGNPIWYDQALNNIHLAVLAPAPIVNYTTPLANSISVASDAQVSITFEEAIDSASFNSSTFLVRSEQLGYLDGTFGFSVDNRTVFFNPLDNFIPGDLINVIITDEVTAYMGDNLANGYSWTFTVATDAGYGTFTDKQNMNVGNYPRAVKIADFNGDGNPDPVVMNSDSNNLSVFFNDGNKNYSKVNFDYNSGGIYGIDFVVLDIENDGDIDMVVGNETSEYWSFLTLLINDGTGNFTLEYHNGLGMSPAAMEVADFNNDGFFDLAICNNSTFSILFNNQIGGFQDVINYTSGQYARSITTGDYDNDGDIDIAIGRVSFNIIDVYRNNGDGTFGDVENYDSYFSSLGIHSADFNNDQYLDLVSAIETGEYMGYVASLLNLAGESFLIDEILYMNWGASFSVISGDWDNDGDLDLAATTDENKIGIIPNDGLGNFGDIQFIDVGQYPRDLARADLDKDGDLDIVCVNNGSNSITILYNDPNISCCEFRGDLNNDFEIGIADLTFFVDYMFINGDSPDCLDEANTDGESEIDISDLMHLVNYLFQNGPSPLPCD